MSGVTPVSTVGAKKRPLPRLPPFATVAPFETASRMWLSTFSTAFIVDQRPLRHAFLEARAGLQPIDGASQAGREVVVNGGLHEQSIRADAGLPGVSVLRNNRALDRGVKVRIVEHDERRVAAQLERQPS